MMSRATKVISTFFIFAVSVVLVLYITVVHTQWFVFMCGCIHFTLLLLRNNNAKKWIGLSSV